MNSEFRDFLLKLGFSEEEVHNEPVNEFTHSVDNDSLSVKYIFTPNESDIFESHQRLWNKNTEHVFIAVAGNQSHLINVKEKPDKERPLKKAICIQSFDYGINTKGFEKIDSELISKASIDSAYFFDFVSKNQRNKKKSTVDKDLLLNLLELKSDLIKGGNDQIVHLLILRCLFIKYLEDRGIFQKDYLLTILDSGSPQKLTAAFDQVARINGDIFKYDDQFHAADIKKEYLSQLALFFKCDYRSGQQFLFPYQFDNIPIQLISHVYEAFLKNSTRKGDGVYYTPDFLVNFMLKQSFAEKLDQNSKATILDPAVGSGAFLVQAFQMIQHAHGKTLGFEEKKEILKTQLYGVDIDQNALQITAFSLYLALLEHEAPAFIREKIEQESPILPSLIGKTLIVGNAILEDLFPDKVFDCIASNPPWGSVPTDSKDPKVLEVYLKERAAIANKSGDYPEYEYVADYERSQAFLTRVAKWGDESTSFVMVVKNSIFLNDKTFEFRQDVLRKYQINTFYELSHYNDILFKKSVIGEVHGDKVELGASEPCAVIVFKINSGQETVLHYISPKLTDFANHFEIIHCSGSDSFNLAQPELAKRDSLWKVLVNGDIEAHDLIFSKLQRQKNLELEVRAGFQPKKEMKSLGEPIWKRIIEPRDFQQYVVTNPDLSVFNWNQELHRRRDEEIFNDNRIVVPVGLTLPDRFLLRGVLLNEEIVFKHNMLSVKIRNHDAQLNNYSPYLGIFNSKLIGFIIYQLSVQWGKGKTWVNLRNEDIENLPFKVISDPDTLNEMTTLVETVQSKKSRGEDCQSEIDQLNERVFDLYGLVDYEKEIIREFYDVRVNRAGKKESLVRFNDLLAFFESFKDAYSLMLADDRTLNASYHLSTNMGAVICFSIVERSEEQALEKDTTLDILHLVKNKQLSNTDSLKVLFEEKVKIYDKEQGKFYIIKSNQFKDWTVRQAMKDAKEEIDAFIRYLPTT
ncbi:MULTISPECIES: class I SAM-dependent DNA methyltransferase [unclassified Imperialibacter]|uniref:HsdM family class I SAM-dependent methyltransferase n=1 Tax=unclassified Imperialibacter TaxID=2629706 RepID=UPI001257AD5D|nr:MULTISPECIES: N-6 DNA methylase [unclassified Imperialibacter]CAD5283214.1 conserved hypothetical protein [Imperialibacter sp. 89]CAD5286369.1 conserved hypothetical protein [Imperialibacter sp. 75]VVT29910.1 conserved hypothetical protein [Imperialibacter sp. EC-SDR9]